MYISIHIRITYVTAAAAAAAEHSVLCGFVAGSSRESENRTGAPAQAAAHL